MTGMADLAGLLPIVMIGVVFYFFLLRPQQQKMKKHKEMLATLKKGDKVIVSGIMGVVEKLLSDNEVQVEIAPNISVKVIRSMISDAGNSLCETSVKTKKETEEGKNSSKKKKT